MTDDNLKNRNVSVFYVLLTVHLGIILVNNQFDAEFFSVYVYFDTLHVSSNRVLIIRRINFINTTSGICQMYWYNGVSWWLAHGCSKRVECRNKHIRKRIVCKVGYLQEMLACYLDQLQCPTIVVAMQESLNMNWRYETLMPGETETSSSPSESPRMKQGSS